MPPTENAVSDPEATTTGQSGHAERSNWRRLLLTPLVIAAGVAVARRVGLFDWFTMANIERIDAWFNGLGWWAPAVYVLLWIAASVLFLPGLAITVAGGLVFDAVWGTVRTTVGANLGAVAAFLIGRHAARGVVAGMLHKNPSLRKIDQGFRRQGWRVLMITRLLPIFPFNVQNYVYGLTDIPLRTYVLVTLPCMLPATIAYSFAAGSVRTGDFGKTLWYLGIAAVFFVLLSLTPAWVRKRFETNKIVDGR
jgi:uncharacterized membrane protein YdjX (TVP38/TMEM64 family)